MHLCIFNHNYKMRGRQEKLRGIGRKKRRTGGGKAEVHDLLRLPGNSSLDRFPEKL
jgi:hypothetical protein